MAPALVTAPVTAKSSLKSLPLNHIPDAAVSISPDQNVLVTRDGHHARQRWLQGKSAHVNRTRENSVMSEEAATVGRTWGAAVGGHDVCADADA
jgi:hypothetical protein